MRPDAMKITHYLYNAFLVEQDNTRIAIDPGQNLWLFNLTSLIPAKLWPTVTHIVITHGDPDHHWHSDRLADASNAHVICGVGLTRQHNGHAVMVDPRGRGLNSWVPCNNLHPLAVGEVIELDGVHFQALPAQHG
ncbi:MAG: MBL fold metallo-hydrolase, partial [Pseudomonadota bacterium]